MWMFMLETDIYVHEQFVPRTHLTKHLRNQVCSTHSNCAVDEGKGGLIASYGFVVSCTYALARRRFSVNSRLIGDLFVCVSNRNGARALCVDDILVPLPVALCRVLPRIFQQSNRTFSH